MILLRTFPNRTRRILLATALALAVNAGIGAPVRAQQTTKEKDPAQSASGEKKPSEPNFVVSPLLDDKEGRLEQGTFAPPPAGGTVQPKSTLGGVTLAPPPPPAGKDRAGVSRADQAYGAFQRGYYLTAMKLALPEAENGNAAAQTLVAEMFADGLGVARSMDDAAFWYGQAAKHGDPSAEFNYALLLMHGKYVKKDEAKAAQLMKKAADAGIPAAAFNHAQSLVAGEPGEKGIAAALPYYRTAAEAGIADAQYALSQIYRNSPDIPDAERAKARYWLERAAQAGYDTAQLDLGIWLVDGIDGPKDYDGGFLWMKKAAESGNVMAANRLAYLYRNGIGTPQDRLAAATWYIMARRAGLQDNALEDFFQGLSEEQQKEALKRANALQKK